MLRKAFFVTLLFALLLMLPAFAQAAEITYLYVWDGDEALPLDGSLPQDAIRWYKQNNQRYLYLPAGLNAANLRVRIEGAKSFTVGDQTIENGDVTDVFVPGETVTVKNGKNSYKVTVMQSENTAAVYLNTKSGRITKISESKRNRESGHLCVRSEDGAVNYSRDFDYVRVRGNNSFYPYKKSFHIRLQEGASLLGMDSGKTWLLIASYVDNSMLRNAITFEMAQAAGSVYATDYRFVTVYVNHVYYGVYLLTEKVQVNKGRVTITNLEDATEEVNTKALNEYKRLGIQNYQRGTFKYSGIPENPEDITGGYLLQLELEERYKGLTAGFVTKKGQPVEIKSPEYVTKEQAQYISSVFQSFENAIWAEDGVDPETGKHYTQIADLDSIVSKYLIEEISKNLDANKSSFYVYKDSDQVDGKLYFGPVWDYDNAYANFTSAYYGKRLLDPATLHAATDDYKKYYWFPLLYQHEDFVSAVKEAYAARFRPCLEVLLGQREPGEATGDLISLDTYEEMFTAAAAQNFSRWNTFNHKDLPVKTGADFAENIDYLRTFLTERMAYLDSIWLDD